MAKLRYKNPKTGEWEIISVTEAAEIALNNPDFVSKNVSGALTELRRDQNILLKNIAYIYKNGTIGGGGGGGNGGGGQVLGEHIIIPVNFSDVGDPTYFSSSQDVVLRFTIKSSSTAKFNITAKAGTTIKTATGKNGQLVELNLGKLAVGKYQVFITGSTASGLTLDPTTAVVVISRLDIDLSAYDPTYLYSPYVPAEVVLKCNSDYTSSKLILHYTVDGGSEHTQEVVHNATTTLKIEHKGVIGNHPVVLWLTTTDTQGNQISTPKTTIDLLVGSDTDLYVVYSANNPTTCNTKLNMSIKYSLVLDSPKYWDVYYEICRNDAGHTHISGAEFDENGLLIPGSSDPLASGLRSGTYSVSIPTADLPEGEYALRLHGKESAGIQESINDTYYVFTMINNEQLIIYDPVQTDLIAWFNGSTINPSTKKWVNKVNGSAITCDLFYCDGSNTGVINNKDSLILSGGAYARINYAPFAKENAAVDRGLTIQITYKVNRSGSSDSRIMDCGNYSSSDELTEGFSLKEDSTTLKTTACTINTELASDQWIHATYTVKRDGIRCYLNGILTVFQTPSTQDKTSHTGYIYLGGRKLEGNFTYLHIMYSAEADGSHMTTLPSTYVGIATTSNAISPTDPKEYIWRPVTNPKQGGDNVWIRYSANANGANHTSSTDTFVGYYIGPETEAPADNTLYTWARTGGSDMADFSDCEIHDIKIYNTNLSAPKIVFNYVCEDYTCPENITYLNGVKVYDDERQKNLRSLNSIIDNTTSIADTFEPDLGTTSPYPIINITFNDDSVRQNFWSYINSTNMGNDPHKFDQFPCHIKYTDNERGITLDIDGFISLQGTTSLNYKSKNFDIFFGTDANNRPILFTPRPYDKVSDPSEAWLPENNYTIKCNLMDSSHANNLGAGMVANDLFDGLAHRLNAMESPEIPEGYTTQVLNETGALYAPKSAASQNPNSEYVKNAVVGFPCLLTMEDTKSEGGVSVKYNHYLGVHTFNTGRKSYYNLGLKACYYDLDPNGLVVDYSDITDSGIYNKANASIYAYEADSSNNFGSVAFKQFDDATEGGWIASEWSRRYPEDADVDLTDARTVISDIIRITSRSAQVNTYKLEVGMDESHPVLGPDGQPIVLIDANDPTIVRWNDNDNFIWWNKSSLLDYFLCVLVLGMSDSLGKNFVIKTWGKAGDKRYNYWYATFYDMDTIIGLDNVGNPRHEPDMDIDTFFENQKEGGGNGFTAKTYGNASYIPPGDLRNRTGIGKNGNEEDTFNLRLSRLWGLLRDNNWASKDGVATYGPDLAQDLALQSRWRHLRKSGIFTLENLMKKFTSVIHSIGANYYNKDAEIKYLNDAMAAPFMHGTREFFTRAWLDKRIQYLDSLFQVEDIEIDGNYGGYTIDMRLNEFTTGLNKTALFDVRSKYPVFITQSGESANLDNFSILTRDIYNTTFAYSVTANDKPFKLNYAPLITSIENIEKYNPSQLYIYEALNLTKLSIPNCKKLNDLNISQCYALTELDVSGCTALTKVDLTNCLKLQKLNIANTGITELNIKSGGLRELNIKDSALKSLTLEHQKFLNKVDFSSCPALKELTIRDTAMTEITIANAGVTTVTIESCSVLESIIIRNCTMLTKIIVNDCEGVKVIEISKCNAGSFAPYTNPNTVEASAVLVAQNMTNSVYLAGCPNLESLNLSGSTCQVVTLSGACTTLKELDLSDCGLRQFIFTSDGTHYMRDTMRGCLISDDGTMSSERNWPALDFSNFPTLYPKYTPKSNIYAFTNVNWTINKPLATGGTLHRITGKLTVNEALMEGVALDSDKFQLNPWYRSSVDLYDKDYSVIKSTLGSDTLDLNMDAVEVISQIFKNCEMITMTDLLHAMNRMPNVKTIEHGVENCIGIKGDVTKDLFKYNPKLEVIHYMFTRCDLQTTTTSEVGGETKVEITGGKYHKDAISGLPNLTDLAFAFYGDNGIKGLVENDGDTSGLFDYNPNLVSVENCFGHSQLPETDPNNYTGNRVEKRFEGSTFTVLSIFGNLPKLKNANSVLYDTGCTIKFESNDLGFANSPVLEDLGYAFYGCIISGSMGPNVFGTQTNGTSGSSTTVIYPFTTLKIVDGLFSNTEGWDGMILPDGLFMDMPKLLSAASVFSGSKINCNFPRQMFYNCSALTSLANTFNGCKIKGMISADNFSGCSAIMVMESTFRDCTEITGIESHLISGMDNLESARTLFQGCEKLTNAPAEVFYNLPKLQNADGIYTSCIALESVEGPQFVNCPEVRSVTNLWAGCVALATISANALQGCSKINAISGLFLNCSMLTSISDTFFNDCPEITTAANVFYQTGVSEIPANLWKPCTKLVSLENGYAECHQLTTIPAGAFQYNVNLESLKQTFKMTTMLTSVPSGLLNGLTKLTTVQEMFSGSGLTEIDQEFLYNGSGSMAVDFLALTDVSYFLKDCLMLDALPTGFLKHCPNVTTMEGFVRGTGLKKIPDDIFKYTPKLINASRVFELCKSLQVVKTETYNSTSYSLLMDSNAMSVVKDSVQTIAHMFDNAGGFDTGTLHPLTFNNMKNLDNACYLFRKTYMKTISGQLFKGCNKLANIRAMFAYCPELTNLDGSMFSQYNAATNATGTNISNVYGCFYECNKLVSGPKFFETLSYPSLPGDNSYWAGAYRHCTSFEKYNMDGGPTQWWLSYLENFGEDSISDTYGDDYVNVGDFNEDIGS